MISKEQKVFLCVKSLFNISNDLKEYFEDYSNMILFIADNIAKKMEKEMSNCKYPIHENGEVHDLTKSVKKLDSYMDDIPQKEMKKVDILTPEEQAMEQVINNAIKEVRSELQKTQCEGSCESCEK